MLTQPWPNSERGAGLRRKLIRPSFKHGLELSAYSLEYLRSQMSYSVQLFLRGANLITFAFLIFPARPLIISLQILDLPPLRISLWQAFGSDVIFLWLCLAFVFELFVLIHIRNQQQSVIQREHFLLCPCSKVAGWKSNGCCSGVVRV